MGKTKSAKDITYKINGVTTPGYLALPDATGPVPGVIVIQEVWGMNDDIRRICRQFADAGYAALSPDLYHGRFTEELEEAFKIRTTMEMPRAVKDMDKAIEYLKSLPEVRGGPVGMIGFCMGGGLTLETAVRGGNIKAGACFYGGTNMDAAQLSRIKVPIFGAFGTQDHLIAVDKVEALRDGLTKAGVQNEVHLYANAGHSFFNDVKTEWYKPAVAEQAWKDLLAFFQRTLR